jgi:hypothetical protein
VKETQISGFVIIKMWGKQTADIDVFVDVTVKGSERVKEGTLVRETKNAFSQHCDVDRV